MINREGTVRIGCYKDAEFELGGYIETRLHGHFYVGEVYSDDTGQQQIRGKCYFGDGNSKDFNILSGQREGQPLN